MPPRHQGYGNYVQRETSDPEDTWNSMAEPPNGPSPYVGQEPVRDPFGPDLSYSARKKSKKHRSSGVSRESQYSDEDQNSRKIFVGGIPPALTKE